MIYFFAKLFIIQRETHFNAALQVAIHPVGAAHIIFGFAIIMKYKYPCMFQIAIYNTAYSNIFTLFFYTRRKTADTTNNELNLYTGTACIIQTGNHFSFLQVI